MIVQIFCSHDSLRQAAEQTAKTLNLALNSPDKRAQYSLNFSEFGVELMPTNLKAHGAVKVDFCTGKSAHRRQFGGGKGQLIAKACGIKRYRPYVLDATAGLGQDAFVLATLGCRVTLLERSAVAHALLDDGLRRAQSYAEIHDAALKEIIERMQLKRMDGIQFISGATAPCADVIYLDPMFPEKTKKAAVNKNMQAFHQVIGDDSDAATLLRAAMSKAKYRVVVKRPRLAPPIEGPPPSHRIEGKSSRYDVYPIAAMPEA